MLCTSSLRLIEALGGHKSGPALQCTLNHSSTVRFITFAGVCRVLIVMVALLPTAFSLFVPAEGESMTVRHIHGYHNVCRSSCTKYAHRCGQGGIIPKDAEPILQLQSIHMLYVGMLPALHTPTTVSNAYDHSRTYRVGIDIKGIGTSVIVGWFL